MKSLLAGHPFPRDGRGVDAWAHKTYLGQRGHAVSREDGRGLRMLVVGLTGNIGSGKSTVAQMLSERGATIIDADVLSRRAVESGTAAHGKIVARWGSAVLGPDGHLDRAPLPRIVVAGQRALEERKPIGP